MPNLLNGIVELLQLDDSANNTTLVGLTGPNGSLSSDNSLTTLLAQTPIGWNNVVTWGMTLTAAHSNHGTILNSALAMPSPFSIGFYFNTTSTSDLIALVSKQDNNGAANYPSVDVRFLSGALNCAISVGGAAFSVSTDAISTNTNYHALFTFDGSNLLAYRNGVLKNTTAVSGTVGSSSSDWWIGGNPPFSAGRYFNGIMSQVVIYSRALDSTEAGLLAAGFDYSSLTLMSQACL